MENPLSLRPDWLLALIVAPFVGSFLGVVVTRWPAWAEISFSRSACPHCSERLALRDLVPLLSWLLARGRCRYCGKPLGLFYPAVELLALLPVLWAALVMSGWLLWVTCGLGWLLLLLALIDLRHLVLPDVLTLPLVGLGLVVAFFVGQDDLVAHLLGAAAGFVVFVALGRIYRLLRGRDGLGPGDAKLLAAAGAWTTWLGLSGVVLIGAATALSVALARAVFERRLCPGRHIPFGPYLALGFWIVWLHGPLVLSF